MDRARGPVRRADGRPARRAGLLPARERRRRPVRLRADRARPRARADRRRARRRRPQLAPAAPQAHGRQLPSLEPGGRLMSEQIPKTLFLGLGASVVSYYRCFLPALTLGAEYATWGAVTEDTVVLTGVLGSPPPSI